MTQRKSPVAFFDFDGTLTTGDSLMPFLKHLVGQRRYLAGLATLSPVLLAYLSGMMRNDRAKERVFRHFLRGYSRQELQAAGAGFNQETLPRLLRPEGMERLQWHQGQGHACVLLSASPDIYLEDWAGRQGMQAVLCTRLAYENGIATGSFQGLNCFGTEKVARLQTWLKDRHPSVTYAYGDSKGDLPMLRAVTHGFLWDGRQFTQVDAPPSPQRA